MPRKPSTNNKAGAAAEEDEDEDAMLEAAIRANQTMPGSPAALRLEQEQCEARERVEVKAKYVCANCGSHATKRCGGCEQVRYCNQACLTRHWPKHKLMCRELKEAALEAEAAKAAAKAAAEAEAAAAAKAAAKGVGKGRKCKEEHGNCWTCGADNPAEMCGACMVAKYCDKECQKENWPIHKGRCAGLKTHAARDNALKEITKAGFRGMSREELSTTLIIISRLGRVATVERLLAAGASVNYSNDTDSLALQAASEEGHFRVISVLVQHGAVVNANIGESALIIACQSGQLKAAAALLGHGAQIDLRNNGGGSALYMASQNNHLEVVALLLEKGAQIDLPTKAGSTPLIISAQQGHAAVVRILLGHGAQVDARNNDGHSSLSVASRFNHPDVVALLLEHSATVDLQDGDKLTPLFISATNGHVACVRLLLQAGANDQLHEPLFAAILNNHTEIVALLEARIAELAATP